MRTLTAIYVPTSNCLISNHILIIVIIDLSGHPMKDVVLTVPVFFNQAERRAIIE